MIERIKLYLYWFTRKRGKVYVDYERGSGYYLTEIFDRSLIGTPTIVAMKSGKYGIYRLIDYTMCRDPRDMVESSQWQFIGYKNDKPINECTFKEFINIYAKK